MPRPLAIVFDLDDTLYLERDFAMSGFDAAARHVRTRFGIADFAATCRTLFEVGERRNVFDRALETSGIAPSAALVSELVAIYRSHIPRIALASDAAEYFRAAPRGSRFALITDGEPETQMNKTAALGLISLMHHVRCTGAWGREFWKPHPRAFAEAEVAMGAAPTELVYVADNPAKDFVTPRRRGWRTIQIARPGRTHRTPPHAPDYAAAVKIDSLADLESALREPA